MADIQDYANSTAVVMEDINARITDKLVGNYYNCGNCGITLYSNADLLADSHFPAFSKAISTTLIDFHDDFTFGLPRTAISCSQCGMPVGHRYYERNESSQTPSSTRHILLPKSLSTGSVLMAQPVAGKGLEKQTGGSSLGQLSIAMAVASVPLLLAKFF
eukprot:TRINITY_DN4401_c0_g1_i1.p1 TRINITY_DN4401_c0_g1~~TRINITY_DN4401_c0_g1_i1.p1  ORF type:complete len:171 (-),score=17.77 TRINITY_DN4401_c0_g1_i1:54-533(-)